MKNKLNKFLYTFEVLLIFISTLILYVLIDVYFGEVLYCSNYDPYISDRPFSDTSVDFFGYVTGTKGDEIKLVANQHVFVNYEINGTYYPTQACVPYHPINTSHVS
jgi:hypothetical protein